MTTTHPKRRFFRYSLRTLMLVVTVFCIWMGITVATDIPQRDFTKEESSDAPVLFTKTFRQFAPCGVTAWCRGF